MIRPIRPIIDFGGAQADLEEMVALAKACDIERNEEKWQEMAGRGERLMCLVEAKYGWRTARYIMAEASLGVKAARKVAERGSLH